MTTTMIKEGIDVSTKQRVGDGVRETVETTLQRIEKGGDATVRALSEKFDHYSPECFRLSEDEIAACVAQVPKDQLRAIQFSLEQVRTFAEAQRASIHDIEVETLPGVTLGHKNIPVNAVGCYAPGGRYPMIASVIMSVATAKVANVKRVIACAPPKDGKPYPATIATMQLAGRRRDLCAGRYSSRRRNGFGY